MEKCYISVQWHLTENCVNNCKHCYIENKNKELTKENLMLILNKLKSFERKWNFEITSYILTGGDPLLACNFLMLIEELYKEKKEIIILGIPETINKEKIFTLKKYNILKFQLSLDGLEKNHDFMRGDGSYKRTLDKAKLLEENGIKVNIMFTLTNQNKNDLIPLMNIIHQNNISSFSFDFLCSVGNGKNLESISSKEVKNILTKFLLEKEKYQMLNSKTFFHEKSALLREIRRENGEFSIYSQNETEFSLGCYIGFTSFAISADGYFMGCRRLGIKHGNLLIDDVDSILFLNEQLRKYRHKEFYIGCCNCDMFKFCRGCPAVSMGESQNEFAKPKICFKTSIKENNSNSVLENTTMKKERDLIANHLMNKFQNKFQKLIKKNQVQDLVFLCLFNNNEQKRFLNNPFKILSENNLNLSSQEVELVIQYLELYRMGLVPSLISYILGGEK